MPGSTDQRLGALEQDMAVVKTGLAKANHEIELARERYHDLIAPSLQRLVIQTDEFIRTINEIKTSVATMGTALLTTTQGLEKHQKECAEAATIADTKRGNFRKEMRGYFVTVLLFAVSYFVAQKFHISISPNGP